MHVVGQSSLHHTHKLLSIPKDTDKTMWSALSSVEFNGLERGSLIHKENSRRTRTISA